MERNMLASFSMFMMVHVMMFFFVTIIVFFGLFVLHQWLKLPHDYY